MEPDRTLKRTKDLGLLAVVRGESRAAALEVVGALVEGGVLGIEITFTTPEATQVIRDLDEEYGDRILLGAGTVTTHEQVEQSAEAGATFLVSPHCRPELARAMVDSGLVVMVGALTPTEVEEAYRLGSDVVKIFPASLVGPSYLKSLQGPFPYINTMPSGGVNAGNIKDWFAAGAYAVGAGSELCPIAWAKEGRFADITARAGEFAEAVRAGRSAS